MRAAVLALLAGVLLLRAVCLVLLRQVLWVFAAVPAAAAIYRYAAVRSAFYAVPCAQEQQTLMSLYTQCIQQGCMRGRV
jgi:hypothetical protein